MSSAVQGEYCPERSEALSRRIDASVLRCQSAPGSARLYSCVRSNARGRQSDGLFKIKLDRSALSDTGTGSAPNFRLSVACLPRKGRMPNWPHSGARTHAGARWPTPHSYDLLPLLDSKLAVLSNSARLALGSSKQQSPSGLSGERRGRERER